MSKFLLKAGEKLTISINRKSKESSGKSRIAQQSKGIIKSRKPADYLKRRLSGKPIKLNFYDFGWLKDESNIFKELNFVPKVTFSVVDTTQDDYDELTGLIFAVAAENWKTRFKNLSDLITEFRADYQSQMIFPVKMQIAGASAGSHDFDYQISTYAGDAAKTEWTNEGLQLSKSDANKIGSLQIQTEIGRIYNSFDLADPALHVTESFVYAAPVVKIPLDSDLDIFFVPALIFTNANAVADYLGGETPPRPEAYAHSSQTYNAVLPAFRQAFYDRDSPVYNFSPVYTPSETADDAYLRLKAIATIPGNLATHIDESVVGTYPNTSRVQEISTRPATDALSIDRANGGGKTYSTSSGYGGTFNADGVKILQAVVRSKDKTYYIWK